MGRVSYEPELVCSLRTEIGMHLSMITKVKQKCQSHISFYIFFIAISLGFFFGFYIFLNIFIVSNEHIEIWLLSHSLVFISGMLKLALTYTYWYSYVQGNIINNKNIMSIWIIFLLQKWVLNTCINFQSYIEVFYAYIKAFCVSVTYYFNAYCGDLNERTIVGSQLMKLFGKN